MPKYNSELHHLRMGEYKKTNDDKQACIIKFVLLSILSTNLSIGLRSSSLNNNIPRDTNIWLALYGLLITRNLRKAEL